MHAKERRSPDRRRAILAADRRRPISVPEPATRMTSRERGLRSQGTGTPTRGRLGRGRRRARPAPPRCGRRPPRLGLEERDRQDVHAVLLGSGDGLHAPNVRLPGVPPARGSQPADHVAAATTASGESSRPRRDVRPFRAGQAHCKLRSCARSALTPAFDSSARWVSPSRSFSPWSRSGSPRQSARAGRPLTATAGPRPGPVVNVGNGLTDRHDPIVSPAAARRIVFAALVAVGLLLTAPSLLWQPSYDGPVGFSHYIAIPFCAVGAFVAARLPRNPIGWLFLAWGSISAVQFAGVEYGYHTLVVDPGSLPAGRWIASAGLAVWHPGFVFLVLIMLLFPNGRLMSGRGAPVAWLAGANAVFGYVSGLLAGGDEDFEPWLVSPDRDRSRTSPRSSPSPSSSARTSRCSSSGCRRSSFGCGVRRRGANAARARRVRGGGRGRRIARQSARDRRRDDLRSAPAADPDRGGRRDPQVPPLRRRRRRQPLARVRGADGFRRRRLRRAHRPHRDSRRPERRRGHLGARRRHRGDRDRPTSCAPSTRRRANPALRGTSRPLPRALSSRHPAPGVDGAGGRLPSIVDTVGEALRLPFTPRSCSTGAWRRSAASAPVATIGCRCSIAASWWASSCSAAARARTTSPPRTVGCSPTLRARPASRRMPSRSHKPCKDPANGW